MHCDDHFTRSADGAVICPACGGANPPDAVFCGSPDCRKALGEFKYVIEEVHGESSWLERLADRATHFTGHPHFITLHVSWFAVWVILNSGLVGLSFVFDEFPYALLGLILAIEAILITGFLLISQSREQAHAEKRAELDYEVNVRSYRKLDDMQAKLDEILARLEALDKARESERSGDR